MSLVNVTNVVLSGKFASTIEVVSASGGYDGNGVWQQSASTSKIVRGTVLPASFDEIEQMEMGGVSEEIIKILTNETVQLETPTNAADRLVWGGRTYKVLRRKDNSHFGFVRYYAALENK